MTRRVAVYSDHTTGTGGGENFTLATVAALAERGEVELFVGADRFRPDAAHLAATLGMVLDPARVRVLRSPEELRNYDLFVNVSHFNVLPPLARRNVLAVFFPQLQSEWTARYDAVLAISRYTAEWVGRYWNLDRAFVAYPTFAASRFVPRPKSPLIVSVGRFFRAPGGNAKNHDLMIDAFRALVERGLTGWRLALVGASYPEHADYLAEIRARAAGLPVDILPDASIEALTDLYARAAIYWHAAGLTRRGLTRVPSAAEHFGITILEAMASGAVPIVAGIGGAAEIVEHASSGFLALTSDDLVRHTSELTSSDPARHAASAAAVRRAAAFSPRRFADRLHALVDTLFADRLTQADMWRAEGRLLAAADLYAQAVDEYSAVARPYFGLGECLYRTGRRELSLAMLRRGLEIEPACPDATAVRALIDRIERQRQQVSAVRTGHLFGEDYFERGAETGVSGYTAYDGNAWAARHAEVIDSAFSPLTCLDVGCAKGEFVAAMRGRGVRCVGTDISQFSVAAAGPDRAPHLAAASMSALPFGDNAFDLVVAIEVMEHVPPEQVEQAIRELWRVARHYVFVTVQNTTAADAGHFFADLSHCTMKPLDWWRHEFHRAGFEVIATELPLGEFVNHQIIARPMGKLVARGQADIDAEWRRLAGAAAALVRHDPPVALRVLRRALTLAEHAADEGLRATPLRGMTCDVLANTFETMGWPHEARHWREQGTGHGAAA